MTRNKPKEVAIKTNRTAKIVLLESRFIGLCLLIELKLAQYESGVWKTRAYFFE